MPPLDFRMAIGIFRIHEVQKGIKGRCESCAPVFKMHGVLFGTSAGWLGLSIE